MSINKFFTKILCILTYAFFSSCNNHQLSTDLSSVETITIDYEKLPIINTDSIISDIRFIRLETTENNLVARIDKIFFINDRIVIVDKLGSKSIHIFNENGKHISRVSHLGNGPQEYLTITDVDITPAGQIAVKDNYKDAILYFDTNGTFIKKEDVIEGGLDMVFVDGHTIAHELIKGFNCKTFKGASLCISTNNKIEKLFGKFRNESNEFNHKKTNTLFSYNNIAYFTPSWENYIYELHNNSISAKYYIDLKDDVLDYDFTTDEDFHKLANNHNLFNGSFIEMKDYTWLNIISPIANNPPVIYSHKDKKTYKLSANISNPLLTYLHMPKALYNDNTIVETISAMNVYINNFAFNEALGGTAFTDSLHNGLTVDDNPIIFLFTIKDDIGKYVIEE